jgi:hypothetical protein
MPAQFIFFKAAMYPCLHEALNRELVEYATVSIPWEDVHSKILSREEVYCQMYILQQSDLPNYLEPVV